MLALLACSAVLAAPGPDAPPADVTRTYQEARAAAGKSSGDQVRLALWCEAHGLTGERLTHLALAVMSDPGNATARGLMGLVSYNGRFLRPEMVADRLQSDALLAEYDARRLGAPYTADGQWALGVWCEGRGLEDQARAHFTAVTRLDPRRPDAWRRLGFRSHGGRWVTEAQLDAERAEAEAQKQADRKWKPILEDYRRRLVYPDQRAEAESGLAAVTDPRAVPSIVRVFGGVGPTQPRAVQLLGQVDAPSASKALAILAVAARSAEARRAATETLRGRDPREYADSLIALLREPIRFEVKHVGGPGSPGELLVEGRRANVRRIYTPPSVLRPDDQLVVNASGMPVVLRSVEPSTASLALGALIHNPEGFLARQSAHAVGPVTVGEARAALPIIEQSLVNKPLLPTTMFIFRFGDKAEIPVAEVAAEAQKSGAATELQLREDVRFLEDYNVAVRVDNDRVSAVLGGATGQSLPPDRRAWSRWYVDQVGYASASTDWTSRSTVIEDVSIAYRPPALPANSARQIVGYDRMSCFGAGTPVRTIAGPRPIESLKVGDRVLTQSTSNGALGYQPILAVHHNPPSATYRIGLEGDAIVSSHFHRFWVAGRGWVMARDLKPGDPVRTLGGVSSVESVRPDSVQPVYNLDVAGDADFFAGRAAALVHDNTLPDPRLAPFDAAPVAVARRGE